MHKTCTGTKKIEILNFNVYQICTGIKKRLKNRNFTIYLGRGDYPSKFFPTCQVRVVRFYVSVLLLFFLLFSSFSSSSSSSSYCDDVCVAMMCVQYCMPDHHCDHARSVWRAGPQPRSCEVSVACRPSTAIM